MKLLWCLLLILPAMSQEQIDTILNRNPFDPDRGQTEEEPEEEIQVEPVGLPILEGTLLLGEAQFAIFSDKLEGKPVSFRVPLNGDLNGYTLVNIDRNFVELKAGSERVKLAMYTGEKENRGGSKSSAAGSARRPAQTITTRPPSVREERARAESEPRSPSRKPGSKKSSRFVRRNPPKPDPDKKKKTSMKNKI